MWRNKNQGNFRLLLAICIFILSLSFRENVYAVSESGSPTGRELTRSDIPDSVFWNYLSQWQGEDGILTTDDMLLIEEISIGTRNGFISNIKGIEFAQNLKVCNLEYHSITDEGLEPLLSCQKLEQINLNYNKLMEMPDFSSMANLTILKLQGNYFLKEDVTEDKYPAGIETAEVWRQNPRMELYLGETTIYKDGTESGTYGVPVEIKGFPYSDPSADIRITDITDGAGQILFDEEDVTGRFFYPENTEYYNGGRTGKFHIPEIHTPEGSRVWEITCNAWGKKQTITVDVIVDAVRQGGLQEVSEEILPARLAEYMISYSSGTYDKDKDGMISYIELAEITYFSIGYKDDNLSDLETYRFLSYMKNLKTLYLMGEVSLSQEGLESLSFLEKLSYIYLADGSQIQDVSPLKEMMSLKSFNFYGASGVKGLTELKDKVSIDCSMGTFSDNDIFDYIFSKTEESISIGTAKTVVRFSPVMQSFSGIEVTADEEGMIGFKEEDPFYLYGIKLGETVVTYTFGEVSHDIKIIVTGDSWDYNAPLETVEEDEAMMHFKGIEGAVSARTGWFMEDGEKNIWNISTRTPEKILEGDQHRKYAARLIYSRENLFSVPTNKGRWGEVFYIDEEDTLWIYNSSSVGSNSQFEDRFQVMKDVADWQEGGYSEGWEWIEDYILIQKKDGSLWRCNFSERYYYDPQSESGEYIFSPGRIEKLESEGVTGVYPNSYLKDGILYYVDTNWKKIEIAENITKVWDNTSIVLAQDTEGNYYTTKGKIEITGTVKEFLMSNCWDYDYVTESEEEYYLMQPTERDMIAGYLLMEDGSLYRSIYSRDFMETDFVLVDTGVTLLEKDYYWKGEECYWFTGTAYGDYVGCGIGMGLYPLPEKNDTSEQASVTLYVNGIPYLTNVYDWTVAGDFVYAVRLDNTLWYFNEEFTPRKVDFSALSTEVKPVNIVKQEIQILDLEKQTSGILVSWSPVEGANSYRIDMTKGYDTEQWVVISSTMTQYSVIPAEGNRCYYRIQALDSKGDVLASSWKFYTPMEEGWEGNSGLAEIYFVDDKGKEIPVKDGIYTLNYNASLKGKTLYLNVLVNGTQYPYFTVSSSNPSTAKAAVWGACIEVTVQGSGMTTITVNETSTGYQKSIDLNLIDKTAGNNSGPKVKVRLKEKLNLFYKDTKAVYELLPTGGDVSRVEFVPMQGMESYFRLDFDSATGELKLVPKASTSGKSLLDLERKELGKALKGHLKITVGDKILDHKIKIARSTEEPDIRLEVSHRKVYRFMDEVTGETFYAGRDIYLKPYNKKTEEVLDHAVVSLVGYASVRNGETVQNFTSGNGAVGSGNEYILTKNSEGKYTIRFVGEHNAAAVIKIQENNWAKPIYLQYKVTVSNAKMKGRLEASKVTLNKHYQGDQKKLLLTTNVPYNSFRLGAWEVTKMPRGAEDASAITVQNTADGLRFLFKEQNKNTLAEGTYMIKIPVTFHFSDGVSYTPKPLYVKLNVIDRTLTDKDVRWKVSGYADIINRNESEVCAQPVISGVNGYFTGAVFSEADVEAQMDKKFTLKVEDGVLKVRLKPGVFVSSNEKNYISPVLTITTESGYRHTVSPVPKISIRCIQSTVKVNPLRKAFTMYISKAASWPQLLPYEIKADAVVSMERIECDTKGFEVRQLGDGRIQLTLTDPAKKTGHHTVKIKFYIKDQAENKKPVVMKVKVVIKK